MVIFHHRVGVAEAECRLYLDPVFRLIGAVAAVFFSFGKADAGNGVGAGQLGDVIDDAVGIADLLFGKAALFLLDAQDKAQAGIDHCLLFEHSGKIFVGNVNVGENIQVGQKMLDGAGAPTVVGLTDQPVLAGGDVFAPLKAQTVFEAVAVGGDFHIAGSVLGGAGAQTVEAQGVFVILAGVVLVFAAGVQFAVDQLPVEATLFFVIVQRDAAAKVLDLDGAVGIDGHQDPVAIAFPGLVDGIGKDLEKGVLATLDGVGAENDARTLAHAVGALEGRDTVVAVRRLGGFGHK